VTGESIPLRCGEIPIEVRVNPGDSTGGPLNELIVMSSHKTQ
jgi:hypothetical protein